MSSVEHATGFPPAGSPATPVPSHGAPSLAARSGNVTDETGPLRRRSALLRARRAARHRAQAEAAAARTLRQLQLLAAEDDVQGPVEAPWEAEQRRTAHEAFQARLRAAKATSRARGAAHAAAARQTAVQGPGDPPPPQPADTTPATTGGAPGNRKNSVAAGSSETRSDLGRPRDGSDPWERPAGSRGGEPGGCGGEARERPPQTATTTGRERDLGARYEQRNNQQQKRMRWLDELRLFTTLPSLRRCGAMPLGGAVSITQKADGSGGFAGLFRCGSVWSCPECAPIVRTDRARTMESYASAWMEAGHGVAMLTLTSRHWKHARLGPQIERTAGAWRRMLQSRWWRSMRETYGVVGATRALEMTHSWANSWHTHIHALIWTEKPLTPEQVTAMHAEIYERWRAECQHAGLGRPTKRHGVRLDPARRGKEGAADLARYLVKLQESGASLGNELLRGDLKTGRKEGRTPFEILRRAIAGDEAERELWLEYEQATRGHRMLTWTGEIRDRLRDLVDVQELAPADVVTADDARHTTAVLVQVTPRPWRETVAAHPGRRGQLRVAVAVASADTITTSLAAAEEAARAAVTELLTHWGMRPGVDFYVPGDDRWDGETGEVRPVPTAPITPEPPRPPRGRRRWETPDQLDADTQLLGIRPTDAVRPQLAARRAAGRPVARDLTRTPTTAVPTSTRTPTCSSCHHPIDPAIGDRHLLCH